MTACDPPRRLEWTGHIPQLFTGRHFFDLFPVSGGTRLIHGENLSGLIPLLFSAERLERQRSASEALNRALEQRLAADTD